jgi:putative SOS response-associated peptidase YedK
MYYRDWLNTKCNFNNKYYINGFDFQKLPIITNLDKDKFSFANWGLIPSWAKDENIRKSNLNARMESIFEKASFRESITNRRCLIPASGFFEWQEYNKQKYPHYVSLKNKSFFHFAGIWDYCVEKDTGKLKQTYAIITTRANKLMSQIHNTKKRMPLILNQSDELKWLSNLNNSEITEILNNPTSSNLMDAYTIKRGIVNRKESLEHYIYPEKEIKKLF